SSCFRLLSCVSLSCFFWSFIWRPPSSTLFPYTTLFRSERGDAAIVGLGSAGLQRPGRRRDLRADGARVRTDAAAPEVRHRAHAEDRKSTRLNSSHVKISYAVFCLKKQKKHNVQVDTSSA